MTLKERNQMQIAEALGEVNRYFFHEHYQRDGTDEELVLYYIEFGARLFAEKHEAD